jgi:hypothetical protein
MNASRGLKALLSSAAVVAAVTVCTPVSANETPAKSDAQAVEEVSSAPIAKARVTYARKRFAAASRVRRAVLPQEPSWFRPRYERVVVAHWPIMLGVGF